MKHIIFSFLIAVLILFCSCEAWRRSETNNHYIVNQYKKEIVHILYPEHPYIKEDSLVFQISNISDTTLEWKISEIPGFGDRSRPLGYVGSRFFNLTDTMSVYFGNLNELFYGINPIPEFLNLYYVGRERSKCKRETNDIVNYYWTVNDSLLRTMQKDYSMLERFKEYYQK